MPETQAKSRSQIVNGAPLERRAWVRYASNFDVSCQANGAMKDAGWPGKVLDISLGGIGLLLRHRFPPGAPLTVELKSLHSDFQRTLTVRVMHSRPVIAQGDACWLVGCAFSQHLTPEELQEFLTR
jgi:PilZ domain